MLQKPSKLTTRELNRYKKLLKSVRDSDNLFTMRSLLTSYVDKGYPYPSYYQIRNTTSTRNSCALEEDIEICYQQFNEGDIIGLGCGDTNGDGIINVLDIIYLVNAVLNQPGYELDTQETCYPGFMININGDINGDGTINVLDIVSLVNAILEEPEEIYGCTDTEAENYNPDATIDDGSCQYDYEIDDIIDGEEFVNRIIDYQKGGPYAEGQGFIPFDDTETPMVHENSGVVIEENNPINLPTGVDLNKVVITAPHAQAQYRPTRWYSSYDPSTGSDYCDGSSADYAYECPVGEGERCYKDSDYCTGAMAKAIGELTGATVIYSRYRQQDPNYYDYLGIDYYGRSALDNDAESNNQMYNMGYGGLQTPAY